VRRLGELEGRLGEWGRKRANGEGGRKEGEILVSREKEVDEGEEGKGKRGLLNKLCV
jgi:hypothetical protein